MKTLLLLRHAKSDWADAGLDDFDRPLAKRGRTAAPLMGREMARRGWTPDLALVSAAARARETWDLVAAALPAMPDATYTGELYDAPAERLLAALRAAPETVATLALVSHNPHVHLLAERLSGPGSQPAPLARLRQKFPTAGLARFTVDGDWRELDFGKARLTHFLTPGDLD